MTPRTIRRAVESFTAWRHARRIRRTYPGVAVTAEIVRECQRKHRPVREVQNTLRAMVHANLKRELQP